MRPKWTQSMSQKSLIAFRTIVLNKIIWPIYCMKTHRVYQSQHFMPEETAGFQSTKVFFKNIPIVKMRTQGCPFGGRGRNSAGFVMSPPQLNSRNPAAIAMSLRAESGCWCVWGISHTPSGLRMKDAEGEVEFFGCCHVQCYFSLEHSHGGRRWAMRAGN